MSSQYVPPNHPTTRNPLPEGEVQWVKVSCWVPVPIKVFPVAPAPAPGFQLPTNNPSDYISPFTPSPSPILPEVPDWDLETGPSLLPEFHEYAAAPRGTPTGLDLSLDPLHPTSGGGPFTPPEALGLADIVQFDNLPSQPDFLFLDPWINPVLAPSQDADDKNESPGTVTPVDTPPAHLHGNEPLPSPVSRPEPDCFEMIPQTADTPRQEQPHNEGQQDKPRPLTHRFHCPQCPKACLNQRTLNRHLWSQHPEYAERNDVKSVKKKCNHCGYFARMDNVQRHERTVHGQGVREKR